MAKITKNPQVKARETKLNKKSKEELIAIVLKKDNTERNLNNQIKSLKGEVNAYASANNNLRKDMEGTLKILEQYKADKARIIDNSARKIEHWNSEWRKADNTIKELEAVNIRNKYIVTLCIIVSLIIGFTIGVLC